MAFEIATETVTTKKGGSKCKFLQQPHIHASQHSEKAHQTVALNLKGVTDSASVTQEQAGQGGYHEAILKYGRAFHEAPLLGWLLLPRGPSGPGV